MHLKGEGTWKIHADKNLIYKVCGVIKFLNFFEFIEVIKKQIVHVFQYRRALHECTELLAGAIKWN